MLFEYETDRLFLKILHPDAANMVLDFYMRDQKLFEMFEPDRVPNFYTVSHQQNLLKCEYNLAFKLSSVRFYVFRKEDPNTIIGTVCFHNIMKSLYSSCELGYKFSSAYHHYGYATEAIRMGIQVMFQEVGLHRISAWVLPDNEPSIRLLERLCFVREGLCKALLPLHGQWMDHLQYALLSPYNPYP